MRSTLIVLASAAVVFAACGGGGTTATQAGGQTTAPGAATTAPQPTGAPPVATVAPAPQPGSGTVTVVLTGGDDAGTYTGGENPNCSYGLAAAEAWGTQYSTQTAGEGQLSSVQMIVPPAGDSDATFTMLVTIGELFAGNNYEITPTTGTGSAQITDNGATAVIHATGTTDGGVGMDVTVNCPSVTRM